MRALDPITRADFRRLSDLRIAEAAALLASGQDEGAYYLAGYAVECALKACICARLRPDQFPPKVDVVRDLYSHDLSRLLALAGLDTVLDASTDATLKAYWRAAKDWTEGSRYAFPGQTDARQLYAAVADPAHGVLPWLQRYW